MMFLFAFKKKTKKTLEIFIVKSRVMKLSVLITQGYVETNF